MKIKKGDTVLIISGKDKGKVAKVQKALPKEAKLLIEGVNLKNKHSRPKKQGEKGQVVQVPAPMTISNVKFVCPKCGKAVRLGYKIEGDNKQRVCKKCGSGI